MKKSLLWMFAAILTCGMTMTSCSTEDNEINQKKSSKVMDLFDFEDGDVSMFQIVDPARMTVTTEAEATSASNVAKFTRSNSSSRGMAFYNFSDYTENAKGVKISFDFMIPAAILAPSAITIGDATVHNPTFGVNEGQYGYTSNGAIFNIGATRGKAYGGANENYFWINDKVAAASQEEIKAEDLWGKWMHVELFVDVENRQYTYDVQMEGNSIFSGETEFLSENAQTCTQIDICAGNSGTYYLDNLYIMKYYSDASIKYADYTINYVDTEGNELLVDGVAKPSITRRAKVGSAITLLDSEKANFTNADGSLKYIYQSDNSENATVNAEGNEITVVYKIEEMAKYKYRLNLRYQYEDGTTERIKFIDGEQFEGQSVQVGYYASYKNEKDGKWYVTPVTDNAKSGIGRYYTFTGNEDKNSQGVCQVDVYYTATDEYVYIAEFEDEALMTLVGTVTNANWGSFNGGLFTRFSSGYCAKLAADSYMYTKPLPAGKYQVGIYSRNDSSADGWVTLGYVLNGELTKLNIDGPAWGNAWCNWMTIDNVEIPEGASLAVINDGHANTLSLDLLTIINQPEPEPEPAAE